MQPYSLFKYPDSVQIEHSMLNKVDAIQNDSLTVLFIVNKPLKRKVKTQNTAFNGLLIRIS
uniref:Uncharacterized protein n=1 Tax=Anguilla anguilla TaxID=7936 RepID=A0A0E9X276_ANGAN